MACKTFSSGWRTFRPLALVVVAGALLQGCATHSLEHEAQHRRLATPQDLILGGQDQVLSEGDSVLSGGVDHNLGGHDAVLSQDAVLSGGDRTLSAGDVWLNSGATHGHTNADKVLNEKDSVQWPDMKKVPKRSLSNAEMTALTVAVSRGAEDPNGLTVVEARVDDTSGAVRNFCARLNDSGLDDENNRYNVVFGIVEARVDDIPLVSIIDAGQRATVVCDGLGYIEA